MEEGHLECRVQVVVLLQECSRGSFWLMMPGHCGEPITLSYILTSHHGPRIFLPGVTTHSGKIDTKLVFITMSQLVSPEILLKLGPRMLEVDVGTSHRMA